MKFKFGRIILFYYKNLKPISIFLFLKKKIIKWPCFMKICGSALNFGSGGVGVG